MLLAVVAAAWLGAAAANAHPAYLTAAEITVEADGSFHGQVRFDTLAYALNDTSARIGNAPMEALLAGPKAELEARLAGARARFQGAFRVVTDTGDAALDPIDFPTADPVLAWRDRARPVLPVVIPARVSGHLPPGTRTVAVRFPPALEQVILTIERPDEEPEAQPVPAGVVSRALSVSLEAKPAFSAGASAAQNGREPRKNSGKNTPVFATAAILLALSAIGVFGWRRRGGT